MTRRLAVAALAAMFAVVATPVSARHQDNSIHERSGLVASFGTGHHSAGVRGVVSTDVSARKRVRHVKRVTKYRHAKHHRHASRHYAGTVIGGRPAGCPQRFCGCALSLKFFGIIKPALNIAENWKGFEQVAFGSYNTVAARRGHALAVIARVEGTRYQVWDPNSGGGRIRIHVRDLRGFTFHNPHGTYTAYRGSPGHYGRRYAKRYRHHRRYASAV